MKRYKVPKVRNYDGRDNDNYYDDNDDDSDDDDD